MGFMLWEKNQINYKVIPTSLFRGCPLIRATTKQACRDDLVVYLIFLSQHIPRSASMYWALFYEDQILHFIMGFMYSNLKNARNGKSTSEIPTVNGQFWGPWH